MGNKIDTVRIQTSVNNLAENKENLDRDTEYKSILEAINGTFTNEFKDILDKLVLDMKEEYILNIIDNTVKYTEAHLDNSSNIRFSIELLSLLVDSIYNRFGNLRDLLTVSFSILKDRFTFPFNVLNLCISIYSNDNFFQNKDVFKNHIEVFEINNLLAKIIYNIIFYQKYNKTLSKHCVEYLDVFKLYLSSNAIDNETVYKFIVGLFLNVFINFKNLTDDILDPNIPIKRLESYIVHNFYLLLWFCVDVNKFFFPENIDVAEYKYENEYNKLVDDITKNIFHKEESITSVISSSNKFYYDSIKNILLYNTHIVRNFILTFFNNEDNLTSHFRNATKMILIYFFELNQVI